MKTLVVYYSRKGSNHYLAHRIANDLSADIEQIRPRMNVFLFFLMNIHLGIRSLRKQPGEYNRVILVGPIWMGKFVPPLRSFVKKYDRQIRKLVFVTCCGSTYAKKDEKFGHGLVFEEVRGLLNGRCTDTQAFPVGLVLPEGHKEDPDAFMKTHLNAENFNGEILEIYDHFMARLGQS